MRKLSFAFLATTLSLLSMNLVALSQSDASPLGSLGDLNPATPTNIIQGSIKNNSDPNKLDIVFKPSYTSTQGEYVLFLQFAVAIPLRNSEDVTATAVGVNAFSNMGALTPIKPYIDGSDRIFGWLFAVPAIATQSWTKDADFTGVEVTFNKRGVAGSSKLLDFTNKVGGTNSNTYFVISSTTGDKTNYTDLFFQIPMNNELGKFPNKDQFVQNRNTNIDNEYTQGLGQLSVTAYPNPYEKGFKLNINSPVSGMATILFYNANGSKVHELKQEVNANISQAVEIKNTASFKASVFYKISVNDYNATGVVVKRE